MKKPLIALSPLWDDDKSSIWMLPGYMDAIRESGGIPIMLPLVASKEDIEQVCQMCDGLLLTGGHDISPELYGERTSNKCGTPNSSRDELERWIFDYAVEHDIPTLGICRGIQLMNALCGGTLHQDLPTEHLYNIGIEGRTHQMTPPYDREWHKVKITPHSPLHTLLGSCDLGVNSYHHQAIRDLSPSLECMAMAEDGIIEAVYMPSRSFVWGVQWHPELNFRTEESSRQIMKHFIAATLKNKK